MRAHALGEVRGERKLAARVGGDRGIGIAGARDERLGLLQALEAQHLAGEDEGVAERQLLDEVLLVISPSTRPPASGRACRLGGTRAADQADLDHRRLDDGADVHAILLGEARSATAAAARRPPACSRA